MKSLELQDYVEAAQKLGSEVAMIMAFAKVEAPKGGFDLKGRVTALFEPHKFWQELTKVKINPAAYVKSNPSYQRIIYKKWKTYPYPSSSDGVYEQILAAEKVHREAAFNSTSWGKFQIMGFNAKLAGYANSIEMVADFKKGEKEQLNGFVNYLISTKIVVHLRNLDFEAMAKAYNGSSYKENEYDTKLEAARLKYLKHNS